MKGKIKNLGFALGIPTVITRLELSL